MMTCEIRITKEDPTVKSVNKDMTKFMTNLEDLNNLQDWVSDEQWVNNPHNTSIKHVERWNQKTAIHQRDCPPNQLCHQPSIKIQIQAQMMSQHHIKILTPSPN